MVDCHIIECPKFKALEVDLMVTRLRIWLNNEVLWMSEFKGWDTYEDSWMPRDEVLTTAYEAVEYAQLLDYWMR